MPPVHAEPAVRVDHGIFPLPDHQPHKVDNNNTNGSLGLSLEFLEEVVRSPTDPKGNDVYNKDIQSFHIEPGTKAGEDNFMSSTYTVRLIPKPGQGDNTLYTVPLPSFFIKSFPADPYCQQLVIRANMFHKECQIYSRWFPELMRLQREVLGLEENEVLSLPVPEYLYGESIDFESASGQLKKTQKHFHPLSNCLVMTDMKKTHGYKMGNRREALDLNHMKLVIEAVAKLHSLSWAYRTHLSNNVLSKFPWFELKKGDQDLQECIQAISHHLDQAAQIYEQVFGPENELVRGAERFKEFQTMVIKYMFKKEGVQNIQKYHRVPVEDLEIEEPWPVISHGDCWINNFLFKYDSATNRPTSVLLLDFQMSTEGCVTDDLQYLFYISSDADLRRDHMDELLFHYYDRFTQFCQLLKTQPFPGFSFEALKRRFHGTKLLGYFYANLLLPLSLRPREDEASLDCCDDNNGSSITGVQTNVSSNHVYLERIIGVASDMLRDGVL